MINNDVIHADLFYDISPFGGRNIGCGVMTLPANSTVQDFMNWASLAFGGGKHCPNYFPVQHVSEHIEGYGDTLRFVISEYGRGDFPTRLYNTTQSCWQYFINSLPSNQSMSTKIVPDNAKIVWKFVNNETICKFINNGFKIN